MREITFFILILIGVLPGMVAKGAELRWDYPASPEGAPPTHFNVYTTGNLSEPFTLMLQVPYVHGQTDYAVDIDTGTGAAFFKLSAANNAGETFARKETQ